MLAFLRVSHLVPESHTNDSTQLQAGREPSLGAQGSWALGALGARAEAADGGMEIVLRTCERAMFRTCMAQQRTKQSGDS